MTINWYSDNAARAVSTGYREIQIFSHEELHLWYRSAPAAGGDFPNPVPGQASFNPSPSVTLSDGTTIQFNLLNSDGSLNNDQYTAYEHVLIHDDQVESDGTDSLVFSLAEAMAQASSVTIPGQSPQKIADTGATTTIINQRNLQNASIINRTAKRPPMTPSNASGCNPGGVFQGSHVRKTRDVIENVRGYLLHWDGVLLPPGA